MNSTHALKKGVDYAGVTIVFLCHDGNGNYLLHKRSENCRDEQNRWDCGGGALEFGDTVEHTLAKEIEEEYKTKVRSSEFLGYRDVHRMNGDAKTHWIALDFKVLVDRESVGIGEPHKCSEIGWFRLEEFPSPLHSQFPTFLNLHKNKI